MAITDLVDSVTDALVEKMSTMCVFIDLMMSFDTLNHIMSVKNYNIKEYEALYPNGLLVT